MTTYQDQPLSRREIREREAAAARAAEAAEPGSTGAPADNANGDNASDRGTDASVPPQAGASVPPEPLSYVTQGRAPLPHYDTPVSPTTPPATADADREGAGREGGDPDAGYRYRDYSPEGRRAARLGRPAAAEPADLDYRTQNREDTPLPPAAASAPPVTSNPVTANPVTATPVTPDVAPATPSASAPPVFGAAPEGTMSRRELRALREAQEREQGIAPADAPSAPVAPDAQTPAWLSPFAASAPPVAASAPPVAASTPPVSQAPASVPPAFDDLLAGEPAVEEQQQAPESTEATDAAPAAPPSPTPPPLVEPAEPRTDAVASLEALFRAQSGALPVVPDARESASPEQATSETEPEQAAPAPTPWQQAPVAPTTPPPLPWQQSAASQPPLASQPPVASASPVFTPPPAASAQPVFGAPASAQPVHEAPPSAQPAFQPATSAQPEFEALVSAQPVTQAPAPETADEVEAEAEQQSAAETVLPPWGTLMPGMSTPMPTDDAVILPSGAVPSASVPPQPAAPVQETSSTSQPPVPGERPRNHWSRQAELDDEAQPATGSISRSVGVGPATANALVLPEVPTQDFIVSNVRNTGDVLVTGSISLPASLASTGALPAQLDESDLDNLLDPGDAQVASTDSQPVRAIRAVSTHTSSREIIGTIKPKRSNRALTALIIAAAGMAAVVVTLLVVALASGVLG